MLRLTICKRATAYLPALVSKSLIANSRNVCPLLYQVATITSRHFKDRTVKKPAPWPYKEKKYTLFHLLMNLDNTLSRFDENTQLIVVEGNIGCGKTEFAKKLADEFEMLYLPEPTVESLYTTASGFDLRTLDHVFPPRYKSYLLKDFYSNPHHPNAFSFQVYMYILRLEQYMEALAHILNTGQGVVLERCVFSDSVFVEAMVKMGYLTSGMKTYYNEVRLNTLHDIDLMPTLVIYLDADVDVIMGRIKKRNIDFEVNSKVLNKDYLGALEHFYKQEYLKYISTYSELLIYDWSHFGDVEEVAHDIERIEFGKYDKYDFKLKEWRNEEPSDWNWNRIQYTNNRSLFLKNAAIPCYDIPEILIPTKEITEMTEIISETPDYVYEKGFNPHMGDKGILWKLKEQNYWEHQKYRLHSYF